MSRADELLEMAGRDPLRTLSEGNAYLRELDQQERYERSVTLRALSLAARHTSQIADSIDYATRSAVTAREGDLERVALLATLTETGSRAISGDLEGALTTIESVLTEIDDEEMIAEFSYQRAVVLSNLGRSVESISSFEAVLPVYEKLGDSQAVMMALNQLGRLHTAVGDLAKAEGFLSRALSIARQNSEFASIPGILHNLGLLASYQGDIPDALQKLYESDNLYLEVSGSDAPQHVARCEVLMSVGLFEEALQTAKDIARGREERGDREHQMQALLVAAKAALLAGRYQEAIQLADEAGSAAGDVTQTPVLLEARAIGVEATLELRGPSDRLLGDVLSVADGLTNEGLLVAALQARALAARISEELGEIDVTIELLEDVTRASAGPVELRLERPLSRARLALLRGDRVAAFRSVRSGLAMLDRFQATLGATELRHGLERRGRQLAEMGLNLAVESRRPRQILDWLDRTRARALRFRPVNPVEDDEMRALMADMRRVGAELRKPAKSHDLELVRRRRVLEQRIAAAQRTKTGTEDVVDHDFSVMSLIDELRDVVLYELGVIDNRLFAVRVENRRARLLDLGDVTEVEKEMAHLRFTLRRAALRGRPVTSAATAKLAGDLFAGTDFGDKRVIVVPPPELMALPWAALPHLQSRPVVVAPSAEMWWRARRGGADQTGVVVAGGPDLEVAEQEVRRVGRIHEGATVLLPGVAVDVVKEEIEGAAVVHIACHATFSVENPMFSSLRLGDGDLNVYDIERLERPPSLVVLSACDSGYTEARAGDELAGLTSALLSMGTRTVVSSVGLVPDSPATSDLMVDFHKGLVAGLEPAEALAAAQERAFEDPERFVSAASFICVGA